MSKIYKELLQVALDYIEELESDLKDLESDKRYANTRALEAEKKIDELNREIKLLEMKEEKRIFSEPVERNEVKPVYLEQNELQQAYEQLRREKNGDV